MAIEAVWFSIWVCRDLLTEVDAAAAGAGLGAVGWRAFRAAFVVLVGETTIAYVGLLVLLNADCGADVGLPRPVDLLAGRLTNCHSLHWLVLPSPMLAVIAWLGLTYTGSPPERGIAAMIRCWRLSGSSLGRLILRTMSRALATPSPSLLENTIDAPLAISQVPAALRGRTIRSTSKPRRVVRA